jgi:Family of unknown function (DUF5709)
MPGQHDYEPLPEEPDLDPQMETSESLAAPPGRDGLDAGYVPADRPYQLNEDRLTSAELAEPETLDERLRRERPDVDPDDDAYTGADPDRTGRLAAASNDADGMPGNSIDAQDIGIDGGAASAEEAAMHHTRSP